MFKGRSLELSQTTSGLMEFRSIEFITLVPVVIVLLLTNPLVCKHGAELRPMLCSDHPAAGLVIHRWCHTRRHSAEGRLVAFVVS